MDNTPLVSVLMTAYNRERYIAEAIDSVLVSTYRNWELIILDDCSGDRTVEIAKSYAKRDSRIKVFVNPENLGQFKNRNKVAEYAKGKYLKYLDSDDLIYPYGLEQLVYYMEQFPDAGYGLCTIEPFLEKSFPIKLSPKEAYEIYYFGNKKIFYRAPLSSIIRREAFMEIGGFPHEAVSGDLAMWSELSQKHSVLLLPQGIIWYRVHADQEMQKTRDSVFVEFEYFKVEDYYLNLDGCPLDPLKKSIALKKNNNKQNRYIFWKLRQYGLKTAIKLLKFKHTSFELNKPLII
jgi:glycosyltransferase involved in cell wall biosynthesis